MFTRSLLKALLVLGFVASLIGCTNNNLVDSIQVTPATETLPAGKTLQFTATATVGHAGHAPQNVTSTVTWSSSDTTVATISSTGMATAVGAGTVTITASTTGFGGSVSGTAALTVTGGGGGGTGGSIYTSVAIIPGTQTVSSPSETTQFIAIGTTATGVTQDLTGQVTWGSSSTQVATVTPAGLATAVNQGTTTITALETNSDGTVVTGTATLTVTNGVSEAFTALTISPGAQSLSASGQTGQFIALGTSGKNGLNQDVTNNSQVIWTSSAPSIATVSSYPKQGGLVTGVSAGQTTITAKLTNADNSVVTANAVVTVTLTSAPEPLLSLQLVPATVTVGNLQDTGQFLAFGTFSVPPYVRDLTNSPTLTWISSDPLDFPINTTGVTGAQAGVITAYGAGTAVVIAEAVNAPPGDGTLVTATATFNCPLVLPDPPVVAGSCYPGSQSPSLLATLTVSNTGANTSDWLLTAPSATGTQDVLHCGPGSALPPNNLGTPVCLATYPVGTPVTITATQQSGTFGGWSSNCKVTTPITPNGPNSCTVTLTTSDSVVAIFNDPQQ